MDNFTEGVLNARSLTKSYKVVSRLIEISCIGEIFLLTLPMSQGVGKNKLIDRLLNLLNKPREYIQLNRDTTVQVGKSNFDTLAILVVLQFWYF